MIYANSDTIFKWDGLTNSITGNYINSATLTGTIYELDETLIATFSFAYVADSNGDYTGTLAADDIAGLDDGDEVIVEITATFGGSTETRRERHTVGYRGFD